MRQDGGSDTVISTCSSSNTATGSNHRQQNEPAVAIDPLDTSFIVASSNDYCGVPSFGDAFQGIYTSTNGGSTWTDSLLPGYPGDTSNVTSTLAKAGDTNSGDPILDWDNSGHLYAGGIAFNRTATQGASGTTSTNGNMYVSTWNKVAVSSSAPLGLHFVRTVIVGQGSSGAFPFAGKFNDKPAIKVDDWSIVSSPHSGNVYASWTLFPGARGQDRILFSRSTDQGQTFSTPMIISKNVSNAEGTDIAVAPNGTVYVFWRESAEVNAGDTDGIVFVKSTDGGKTFSNPTLAFSITPYDRMDGSSPDCGSLSALCASGFTFPRAVTFPQATADAAGNLYVAYEQLKPASDNGDSYHPDGQSRVMVAKSTNGGSSWASTLVDSQASGDQFWPNLAFDSSTGTLAVIYYDSRADSGYSVNRPPGDDASTPTAKNVCISSGVGSQPCDVLDAYIATSTNGGSTWTPSKVSSIGNQPDYEMFGGRTAPFQGDYIWVDARGGAIYGTWTDNRNVVPGSDVRENAVAADGDGFDVKQCRTTASAGDTCPNAGGLDQNIYGAP